MALIERYIDPDATGANNGTSWTDAYTSRAIWEAAEQTDLVADGDSHIAYCRASSGGIDSTVLLISGWVTGSSNTLTLEGDGAALHECDPGSGESVVSIGVPNVTLRKLKISNTRTGDAFTRSIRIGSVASSTSIEQCDAKCVDNASAIFIDGPDDINIENTTVWCSGAQGGGSEGIYFFSVVSASVKNCVVYNFNDGIEVDAGTVTVTNSLVFNNADDFDGTMTVDHCASDDGDGTNAVTITQSASNYAALVTDAVNGDFSPTDINSELVDAGTSSGMPSVDIIGTSRPQGSAYDIGAYEFIQGGGTTVNAALAEIISLAATESTTMVGLCGITETTTIGESTTSQGIFLSVAGETFVINRSTVSSLLLNGILNEQFGTSDSILRIYTTGTSLTESTGMDDLGGNILSAISSVDDGLLLETIQAALKIGSATILLNEVLSLQETQSSRANMLAAITEVVAFLVASTTGSGKFGSITENVSSMDGVTAVVKMLASMIDDVRTDDTNNTVLTTRLSTSDGISTNDILSAIARFHSLLVDNIVFAATTYEVSTLPDGRVKVTFTMRVPEVSFGMNTTKVEFIIE